VAVSGPAPDTAAAAPIANPVVVAVVNAGAIADAPGGATAAGAAVTIPDGTAAVAASVPDLATVTNGVSDPPAVARQILSSGAGRSVLFVVALLGVMAVFLVLHRRTDRGDRKLATARGGTDVARFR
jgi:hypothetical protein